MQGYRTIIMGLVIALGPAVLDYAAGINWQDYVGPTWSPIIAGAIMIAMRFRTTTPVGKK